MGAEPTASLKSLANQLPAGGQVVFLTVANLAIQAAYSLARAFIFPSMLRFWLANCKAMACGCPVFNHRRSANDGSGGVRQFICL